MPAQCPTVGTAGRRAGSGSRGLWLGSGPALDRGAGRDFDRTALPRAPHRARRDLPDVLSAVVRTPHAADDVVTATLGSQSGINRRCPDNAEFHTALAETSLYDRLVRARIRILLEGIEDHLRDSGYTELTLDVAAGSCRTSVLAPLGDRFGVS